MPFDVSRSSVLVTGAGGFIGSHLVAALRKKGATVHAVLRPQSSLTRLEALQARSVVHRADVTDVDQMSNLVDRLRPEIVFNLAVSRASDNPLELRDTNETAAVSLLSACDYPGFRRFVSIGSSLERQANELGATAYARSRAVAADRLKSEATRLVIPLTLLRTFYVYGPLQDSTKLIPTALRAAGTDQTLPLVGNDAKKDFVHVRDLVRACIASVSGNSPQYAEADIASGEQWSAQDVIGLLADLSGKPIQTNAAPEMIRKWDRPEWETDLTPAWDLLGWRPQVTLREGLQDLITNWEIAYAA